MNLIAENEQLIIAYSFDSQDQRLIGSFEYLWSIGTGLAANSTDIQPPAFKHGNIPTFDENLQKWSLVEDHRRETIYSTVDQSKSIVDYIDKIKVGFTLLEPASIFETWTGKAWVDQRTNEEKEAERLKQFTTLTRRQFKLVLLENDLLEIVESAIESIEDVQTRTRIQIEYEESATFERTSPAITYMIENLWMTTERVDELWQQAMSL